jgi:predicted ATPase
MPQQQLDDGLAQLAHAELIFRRGSPPDAEYTFKHALVQDAAYESLLKSKRAELHAQIAKALEEHFPKIAMARPELIAHHYTESGRIEAAIPYWHRAGELALSRLALPESIAHLDRGLGLIDRLAPSPGRDQFELDLRTTAGVAWMTFRGWAAPENKRHADAAWALAQSLGGTDHALRILRVLYVYDLNVGHVRESLKWAEELIRLAEPTRSDAMYGHMAATMARFFLGEFKAVERHEDLIEEKYDLARHRGVADLTTFDPRSVGLDYLAQAQLQLGFPERAVRTAEAALEQARQRGHPADVCYALLFAARLQGIRGDIETFAAITDELERLARDNGLSFYVDVLVPLNRASLALRSGRAQDAEIGFRQAIGQWRRAGEAIALPAMYAQHAQSAALLGKLDLAIALLGDALRQIATPGWEERENEAEVLRMKGWVLSLKGDLANAEQKYRASLEVAREQEARFSELRTAASYARFLKDQGRCAEALAVLAPIYGWFTEGFDTPVLKNAKVLLDQLA